MPMFAVTSPSEPVPAPPRLQRSQGVARLAFAGGGGATRLAELYQQGSAKIRLPRVASGEPAQAILINTSGGLTGGDTFQSRVQVGDECRAIVTTQACERIYRSSAGEAEIETRLEIGAGGRLDWLPQETILFDRGRLTRRIEADLAPDSVLVALEAVIFGRRAMGETVRHGAFRDRWRIRRDGRHVFADDLRLDGEVADMLARPAVAAGAGAMATLVMAGGEPERHLERLRAILGEAGGASAWDGKMVARIVAVDGAALRRILVPSLAVLLEGAALPRIWQS